MTEQEKSVFDELRRVLRLALIHHGMMLMGDPPQDAWKAYKVKEQGWTVLEEADKLEKARGRNDT